MLVSSDSAALHAVLLKIQSTTKLPDDVLYLIDIDPIDML
jgi:hypothetical protein